MTTSLFVKPRAPAAPTATPAAPVPVAVESMPAVVPVQKPASTTSGISMVSGR